LDDAKAVHVLIVQTQTDAAPVSIVVVVGELRTPVFIGRRLILFCGPTRLEGNYVGNIRNITN